MPFRFNDNSCRIGIEENVFYVTVNKGLSERLRRSGQLFSELGRNSETMNEEDICSALDAQFDAILGNGAAEKIFDGREASALERIAVFKYICDEVNAYQMKLRNSFTGGGRYAVHAKDKGNRSRRH